MIPAPEGFGGTGLVLEKGLVIKMGACSIQLVAVALPGEVPRTEEASHGTVRASASALHAASAGVAGVGAAAASVGGDVVGGSVPDVLTDVVSAASAGVVSAPGGPGSATTGTRSPPRALARATAASAPLTPPTLAPAAAASAPFPPDQPLASGALGGRCGPLLSHASPRDGKGGPDPPACFICLCGGQHEPLVESSCACGAVSHRSCLKKWVETNRSRNCSICKEKLPFSATADPPFIAFHVVRHMRGLHWVGDREFLLAFAEREEVRGVREVVIGSHASCDVSLPDPSVSKAHAAVTYDRLRRAFLIRDCNSRAGTFVRVSGRTQIEPDTLERFKFGRTSVCVEFGRLGDVKAAAAARRIAWEPQRETVATVTESDAIEGGGMVTVPAEAFLGGSLRE